MTNNEHFSNYFKTVAETMEKIDFLTKKVDKFSLYYKSISTFVSQQIMLARYQFFIKDDIETAFESADIERPMYIEIYSQPVDGSIPAAIRTVEDQGNYLIASVSIDEHILHARIHEGIHIPEKTVWLGFPKKWTKLYEDGHLIH